MCKYTYIWLLTGIRVKFSINKTAKITFGICLCLYDKLKLCRFCVFSTSKLVIFVYRCLASLRNEKAHHYGKHKMMILKKFPASEKHKHAFVLCTDICIDEIRILYMYMAGLLHVCLFVCSVCTIKLCRWHNEICCESITFICVGFRMTSEISFYCIGYKTYTLLHSFVFTSYDSFGLSSHV